MVAATFVVHLAKMALEGPELILYLAVHKDDVDCIKKNSKVPTRFTSPKKPHIGLREKIPDALARYRLAFGSTTSNEFLVVMRVVFTPLGIAHFTTDNCGVEHHFQCRLSKKIWEDCGDYGVWHFIGDLPLADDSMMKIEWLPVE